MMIHVTEYAALSVLPTSAASLFNITAPFSTQVSCHKEHSSQDRPEYELVDIFLLYGKEYRKNHTLTPKQGKSMYAVERRDRIDYYVSTYPAAA